jgi:signal transduction histidine kinase
MLGRIVNAGQGMQDLIEDILAMAKMEAGKEKVEPDWVEDLSSELLDVVKTFEYEAGARGIGMSLDITHPLPQVEWDIRRIRYHVLNNIISNSLKFTPSGGKIVLSARATEMGVEIRISDTGSGIPENERKRIFNKFEKAENPLYSLHSGSGLGLYNAHLFVTQHGGKIDVENSSDKGTTFLIVLPLSAGSGY